MNNICSYMKIGEILLKQKSITSLELENALKQQRTDRSKKLGTILIENNYITENIMLLALSDQLSIQAIDLDNYYFDPDAAKLLSESTAKRTCCMPLRILDDRILIAMDDPLNIFHIEDIEAETGKKAEVVLARKSQIMTSIDKYMGRRSAEEAAEDFDKEVYLTSDDGAEADNIIACSLRTFYSFRFFFDGFMGTGYYKLVS
jgi:type IV pilus assembly protein PilB